MTDETPTAEQQKEQEQHDQIAFQRRRILIAAATLGAITITTFLIMAVI